MSSGRDPATRKTRGPGRSRERKTARPAPVRLERAREPLGVARDGDVDLAEPDRPRQASRTAPPTIQASEPSRAATRARAAHFAAPQQAGERRNRGGDRGRRRHTGWYNFRGCHPSSAVVTPEVVRKVAELARLRLPEEDLPLWTGQLSRIVGYIDQLRQIPEEAFAAPSGVHATPVRDDVPRPGRGAEALARNAPPQAHGYGVVPRVVGTGS